MEIGDNNRVENKLNNRYADTYNTYDDLSDEYLRKYDREQRCDFDHQWRVYTGDDSITYEQKSILKDLIGADLFF